MAAAFDFDISLMPVNKDLAKERATRSFDVEELTNILDGGPEKTRRRRELEKILLKDPLFQNKNTIYMSKSERYENAVHKSVKLRQLSKQYNWSEEDYRLAAERINFYDEALILHREMFIPALERMCTEEQKAKWLPLAINYRIIGTYAQTELGHGTNVMKLETTATFDPETDEFIMNTPRISSMKWWPGSLGKSCTHAIVLSQLIVGNKQHGLQAFIVPLRSVEDHTPLPGIKVGDIGPKMSLPNVDNGFLIMKDYRIPRENMLMKNAVVTRDGQFRAIKGDKSNYSTMMFVRVNITKMAMCSLCLGCITGTRYSAVRRQTSLKPGGDEVQILDYQAQQYKVFPALAAAFGLFFTSEALTEEYWKAFPEMMKGNKSVMTEIHCQTSVMKALSSDISADHVETMRRGLGGHGHMVLSGLVPLHVSGVTLITVEGENTVLYQQAARYLLKQIAQAMSGGPLEGSAAYLAEQNESVFSIESSSDCRNLDLLVSIYKRMARRTIIQTAQVLQGALESGQEQHEAWNNNMMGLVNMAKAHGWQHIIDSNVKGVKRLQKTASPELVAVLNRLCCLFALNGIETNSGRFLKTEVITPAQLELIESTQMNLFSEIRPDAVSLVDAFDCPDPSLHSVLGCYDGNVYERMYQSALREQMNETEVHPSYYKYLRGLIKGTGSKL